MSTFYNPAVDWIIPSFIGRETELNLLVERLINAGDRVALISGLAGMGKTALASVFAARTQEHFPGGVFSIRGTPIISLSEQTLGVLPISTTNSLLIINDAEQILDADIERELSHILQKHHALKVILTSRRELNAPSIDLHIQLQGFTLAEASELFSKLSVEKLGEGAIEELFSLFQGNPLLIRIATDLLQGSTSLEKLYELLRPVTKQGLVGPDGLPLRPSSKPYKIVVSDIVTVSDELLKRLVKEPQLLYQITPRLFEELVAELLGRLGYEVSLTPASKDGGKDIFAAKRNELGSFLYIVECKKYAPDHPVGVGLVRQLYGVVQAEKATAGILANHWC